MENKKNKLLGIRPQRRYITQTSNKVLKKNDLRLGIILLVSSKLLLFLSFHRHQIKQCGAAIHTYPCNDAKKDLANKLTTLQLSSTSPNKLQINPTP